MKLGVTISGLAARLARRRIAHTREEAIRAALQAIAARRQQQSDGNSDPAEKPSKPSERNNQTRS